MQEIKLSQISTRADKDLDKKAGEFIEKIWFQLPQENTRFNFEKVSKRTHLDIASVNSAINISDDQNVITAAGIAAGGVGPVTLSLKKNSELLTSKKIKEQKK